jgi:TonB family protein
MRAAILLLLAAGPALGAGPCSKAQPPAENPEQFSFVGPRLIWSCEPAYTEEARRRGVEGTVVLRVTVGGNGRISRRDGIRVVRGLGYGLDEKAIEAVLMWRFGPEIRHGNPVSSPAQIEVQFRLESGG